MGSFASQFRAFWFKNRTLLKRRKGMHIFSCLVMPVLVMAPFVIVKVIEMSMRRDGGGGGTYVDRKTAAEFVNSRFSSEMYTPYAWEGTREHIEYRQIRLDHPTYSHHYDRHQTHKGIVFINEVPSTADPQVLQWAERVKTAIGTNLSPLQFDSTDAFAQWVEQSEHRQERMYGDIPPEDFGPWNLAAVVIARPRQEDAALATDANADDGGHPCPIDVIVMPNVRYNRYLMPLAYHRLAQFLAGANAAKLTIRGRIDWDRSRPEFEMGMRFAKTFPVLTALSFLGLLSLYLSSLLKEKEDRILMLMRLNGMTIHGYAWSQLIWFFLLALIPFVAVPVNMAIWPFVNWAGSQAYLIVLCFLMEIVQICMFSLVLSVFFKRNIVGISLALTYSLLAFVLPWVFHGMLLPRALMLIPLTPSLCAVASLLESSGRTFGEIMTITNVWLGMLLGLLYIPLLYALVIYLFNVWDQGYSGMQRPWYYPVADLLSRRKREEQVQKALKKSQSSGSLESGPGVVEVDSDVRAQMALVDGDFEQVTKTHALVFQHVSKLYKGGKLAVEDVTMALKGNQIFGLLGPNGAGKTTMMHITAGLYDASSGRVVLHGKDSRTDRSEYFRQIGFCPQHDIYWRDMTVKEHLRFFELLRAEKQNLRLMNLEERIGKTLESVRLTQYANTWASKISGGERRRLSLAMALSGDSKVVLLDEPTTGLDPKVRRLIWDIISECKRDRLMILTTHSMEEAELLSSEITIMAHGRLRCFGTADHLKQKFGGQIFVNFECLPGRLQDVVRGIQESCPPACSATLLQEGLEGLSGKVRLQGTKHDVLKLMPVLLQRKSDFGMTMFGIVQSSLDDVFMNIVRECDADA
jgi:ABC-type multidrug transport system ATPase subunit